MLDKNSTIFRTINTDAKRLTEQFGLLGKSFRDIKKDFANGLGVKNSLFQTSISKSDWQSLQKFNSAIKVTNDGLTKSQRITKAWNENMTGCSMAAKRMGNDLVTGKKKIADVSTEMKTATASTKALGVAMNIFANVGFMLAITAITKVVSELAQAQSNAVQAAQEATEAYNDELSSIEDYKTRLSELHKELNSGNLSYEETKTKRTELMSIQDELIEKFGTEKGAIESVTEAVKGQVDALDDLNEKSYRDWVAKADKETIWTKLLPGGKSGLDQAIDYMETNKTVSFYDMANANSTTQDKYQAPITNEIRAIQAEIDKTIQSKYNLEKEFATFKLTGTPDEIKSQLESIRQDYLDLSKEAFLENGISSEYWEAYRSEALDSINEVINSFDEGLKKHQETYQTYIEGMIKYDSEYSDEYATILQKRAELESAENSGNEDDIKKARQEFMDAINSGIEASGNNENVKKYFESLYPELQAEFANWNFEFSINANTDGLAEQAKEIGEKYSATDLLNMANGTQEGEESFNKLIDKAIEYGVCTDNSAEEVQKLIDLLVELGIVQGNVQGSTSEHKTDISISDWLSSSFSKDQTYQQLIDDWKSDLKEMSTLLNDIRSGDTTITNSDAIAQFPDLKPYIDQFGSLEIAVDNFIRDSYDELIKKFGNTSNIQGFGYEIQHLKNLLNEGLGGSNNIDKLNESFEELVNIRERIKNGDELSTEEMALLIDKYDALQDAVIETANGYQIEDKALVDLINNYIKSSNTAISAQIEQTKTTIESILDRVKYYGVEAEALENIYNIYRTFGAGATGAPLELLNAAIAFHDANKELNELLELLEDNQANSNKYKSITDNATDTIDWIETLLSRIQRTITNLGKTVSATYKGWSKRNNALAQEMGEINKEISTQVTAYNTYMAKANSISLPDEYKSLVRNGGFSFSEIKDEALKKNIDLYRQWYEKALNCSDAIEDLRSNLADLAKTKFDNVSKQYDNQMLMIDHNIQMLQGFVEQSESAGYMASEVYYQAMTEKQQENITQLQDKYNSLLSTFNEAVNNGSIEKYSEEWYDMLGNINDVEEALQSANTQLIKFNQTLQQLGWSVFDRIRDSVDGISTEANFLIDLISRSDLFTEGGQMTNEGLAVQGLHAVNYNTYMEQSLAYAKEIEKINDEIAKDPYDLELINRKNELIKAQQEAIQNANAEKESIHDLVSQGYDKMLESLQNVINKRKELLNSQKD